MRTLFVTSFHSYISRNILSTDFLPALKRDPDLRIVIVVPEYKLEYFKKQFEGDNVFVEGIPPSLSSKKSKVGLLFKRLSELIYISPTITVKRKYKHYHEKKHFYFIFSSIIEWFGHVFLLRRLLRLLDTIFSPRGYFIPLLEKYKPDLVFSTDLYAESDVSILKDAKRRGIKTVGMVRSWDNPSKYNMRVFPDYVLTGAETLKDEMTLFHRYPKKRITVTGYPHYDRYTRGPTKGKKEFFEGLGLDPNKKLIFFSPVGDDLIYKNDFDEYIMNILGELPEQVLVRFPPASAVNVDKNFSRPNMTIDIPGVGFSKKTFTDREITPDEDLRLLHSLYYSDVVITGPTSIPLDAAFFDKPIIVVDFYPTKRHPFDGIYEYAYFHFQKLLKRTTGVRHVRSKEEFLTSIHDYLKDPYRDAKGRAEIRDLWFSHNTDGKAGERLASTLVALLPSTS